MATSQTAPGVRASLGAHYATHTSRRRQRRRTEGGLVQRGVPRQVNAGASLSVGPRSIFEEVTGDLPDADIADPVTRPPSRAESAQRGRPDRLIEHRPSRATRPPAPLACRHCSSRCDHVSSPLYSSSVGVTARSAPQRRGWIATSHRSRESPCAPTALGEGGIGLDAEYVASRFLSSRSAGRQHHHLMRHATRQVFRAVGGATSERGSRIPDQPSSRRRARDLVTREGPPPLESAGTRRAVRGRCRSAPSSRLSTNASACASTSGRRSRRSPGPRRAGYVRWPHGVPARFTPRSRSSAHSSLQRGATLAIAAPSCSPRPFLESRQFSAASPGPWRHLVR